MKAMRYTGQNRYMCEYTYVSLLRFELLDYSSRLNDSDMYYLYGGECGERWTKALISKIR